MTAVVVVHMVVVVLALTDAQVLVQDLVREDVKDHVCKVVVEHVKVDVKAVAHMGAKDGNKVGYEYYG